MSLVAQIAVFLAAAVIAVPLFRVLKLSPVLAYVAAGLIIGPWGLKLISDVEHILELSEFGIVLLLFVIGLELQPSRLLVMRRVVFGIGTAQVVSGTVLLGLAALLLGLTPVVALVVGFGLTLSSTPLVLQMLAERGELQAPHGRAAFGVLLFQDLAVLPMLAILPVLAPAPVATSSSPWWLETLKVTAVVGGVIVFGRLLLGPALRVVARIKVPEVFTAAALLTVLATALLMHQVGLSMALGAFLAGVLLADSEFRHQLEADIEPFKGLLLGLFFIAVGMSANLGLLLSEPLLLLGLTVGFMALKALAIVLVGKVAGRPMSTVVRLASTLPAGGEFAFVLFTLAVRDRILDARTADLLILAVTLSMILAPLVLLLRDFAAKHLRASAPPPFDSIEPEESRVIIAGFGRFGQIVGRVLRARHIAFTALDVNQTHVDFVRRFGSKVYYGDASRLDLLRSAGAGRARVLVIAVDDVEASKRIAALARLHFPHLKVLARARSRQHAFALMDLKVNTIVRETYASSLEMAGRTLETLGDSSGRAARTIRQFRLHDEDLLLEQYAVKEDEAKLAATSKESAQQLQELFEADAAQLD